VTELNTIKAPTTRINAPEDSCNPAVRDKILAMIDERGIKHGLLSLNIARQLYPKSKTGDQIIVGPAQFVVGE